jgi:phosphohistidine swiveling domain-containing protein
VPLTIGGGLPAAAVAEASASAPSPFRVWSAATIVTEAMAAVPLMVVPMRETTIVPMLKSITAIITTPESVVPVCALSLAAVVASHKGVMHREAVHLSAMAAPHAAAMAAATAARQRTRVA